MMFRRNERLPRERECKRDGGTCDQFRKIGSYSREDKVEDDNEFLSVTATSCYTNFAIQTFFVKDCTRNITRKNHTELEC